MRIPDDLNSPCLGPLPDIEPPRFDMPASACDTHAHVISPDTAKYPLVAARSYTPAPAPEEAYFRMLQGCGMSRGVLIQVSVYGTDNRYMVEVLKRNPDRLRGVAVIDPTITDRELAELDAIGVRGIRINVLFGGGIGFDAMETLAARIAPLGWHMQFLLDARQLPEIMPRISKLPCPIVIDHMGHVPASLGVSHSGFQALLHLVKNHDVWVKLSGAYRLSTDFDRYADVTPLAHALVDAAPQRLVWGSDWPHVAITQMPNTGHLLNQLEQWVPDEATRNRILVDNPRHLYKFV